MTYMTRMMRDNWTRARKVRSIACCLILAGMLPISTGCDEEDIGVYQATKSEPYVEPAPFTSPTESRATAPAIRWDVPEGWNESPNASSILYAVFEAKSGLGDARITVTQLSSDGGGVLANINRWRGQVGQPAIQSLEEQTMEPIRVGNSPTDLIDLIAPGGADAGLERLMVVMVPRPQEGITWYFKMTGPTAVMDAQKSAFVSFVGSVRFAGDVAEHAVPESGGGDE